MAERPLAPPLVWPGARGFAIRDDAAGQVPAARLTGTLARLAHAWGEQNLRLLDAGFAAPGARLVLRRDVRERVEALAPFFAQGEQVTPVTVDGALHWIVRLYSASDWYPLAGPIVVAGHEWRSWRHAATAVLDAATGRVRLVAAPEPDALAATWLRMFPSLFVALDALPVALARQLPPDVDGAFAQATVLGAAGIGLRGEGTPVRRQLVEPTGDTLVAYGPTAFSTGGAAAVALPLVDGAGALSGVVVTRGGATTHTRWLPAALATPAWDMARDRLLRGVDTATSARDGRVVSGAVRAVPVVARGLVLVQSHYRMRSDGPPELLRTAALVGDSVRLAPTLAAALGGADSAGGPLSAPPLAGADPGARAAALYDRMRDALRRGDWRAFGEAFDALGAALGRGTGEAPRPAPR